MDLLAAADSVSPVAQQERAEADALGRLTDAVVAALREARLTDMKLPVEVGGLDAESPTQFDVHERLAYADGATAWTLMALGTAGAWTASRLPDDGIAEIVEAGGDHTWPLVAGTFPFHGRAVRDGGGWRVSGRWGFASGIRHAAWVSCGCLTDAGGRVWCTLPIASVTIEDTWHADGLQATGSTHYRVEDVWVPDHRCFSIEGPGVRGGASHRLPTLAYLLADHTAVCLGLARRALDETAAAASGRHRMGATTGQADRGAFCDELARHDVALRAARLLVRTEIAELCADASPDVLRARTAALHAVGVVRDAVLFAHRSGGATAATGNGAVRRVVQDALVASQHIYFDDEVLTRWGQMLVGA
ncbi:MAG: hypothetical protein KDB21_10740 [Acidimicrobiales bacterium]|nr:hypothetical protein [Acidimicrobiales bacterium]